MVTLVLAAVLVASSPNHRLKVAVLDLVPVTGSEAADAKLLTAVMVSETSKAGDFDVISSADIQGILSLERQRQLLGCSEGSSCLAEIGGALGVDYVINGQLGKLGNRYRLDLRLLDATRAHVVATEGDFVGGSEDALGDAAIALVGKLLVDGHLRTANLTSVSTPAAGGLTASPQAPGPSRTPAYLALGAAGALALGGIVAALATRSTYAAAQSCYQRPATPTATCRANDSSLKWSGPLADGLFAGAIVAGAASTYFFLRPTSASGSGGEVGIGGKL